MQRLIVLTMASSLLASYATADSLLVSCREFGQHLSADDLASRFGASNVSNGQVYVGEGFYEPGTVLFPEIPDQRAEFTWKDVESKRGPKVLRIRGYKSQWRSPQGLTLGLSLSSVERLNRGPFRLRGFGWDYGGTTTSWAGGALAQAELPACVLWARFWEREETSLDVAERRLVRQVLGEREFSSGHPGMQIAAARLRIMGLSWR